MIAPQRDRRAVDFNGAYILFHLAAQSVACSPDSTHPGTALSGGRVCIDDLSSSTFDDQRGRSWVDGSHPSLPQGRILNLDTTLGTSGDDHAPNVKATFSCSFSGHARRIEPGCTGLLPGTRPRRSPPIQT